jgi:hypothetical protein
MVLIIAAFRSALWWLQLGEAAGYSSVAYVNLG